MVQDFWFYIELGLFHVLDLNGYDHVLFLIALAVPFIFSEWKKVFWLATLFTFTHCLALALAVYEWVEIPSEWVEFLIPITIFITALTNILLGIKKKESRVFLRIHLWFTGFFGLIHGLGFSNYFRMLMAGETDKNAPLFGFAIGIELAQLLIILTVLLINLMAFRVFKFQRLKFIMAFSLLILLITLPLIVNAYPL